MLEITNVEITEINNGNLLAYVRVTLNHSLSIRDIRLIMGNKGVFLQMPNKRVKDFYIDVCHPINQETRKLFEDAIFSAYDNMRVKL